MIDMEFIGIVVDLLDRMRYTYKTMWKVNGRVVSVKEVWNREMLGEKMREKMREVGRLIGDGGDGGGGDGDVGARQKEERCEGEEDRERAK